MRRTGSGIARALGVLLLVGAAFAEYFWTVVADAAARLGGRPAGVDALRTAEEAARA